MLLMSLLLLLCVIEPVPVNTPVTWCHRMVTVPKHNEEPRRTVDMQSLNKASVRQTHHTRSPFMLASSVFPQQNQKCPRCLELIPLGATGGGRQGQDHLHHPLGEVQAQGVAAGVPDLGGWLHPLIQIDHRRHQEQSHHSR